MNMLVNNLRLGHKLRLQTASSQLTLSPSLPSHSSSEEDNANSLDEKYGNKEKRDTYPMEEVKKNPESSGKLLDQPTI